jgi:hypothetical protein
MYNREEAKQIRKEFWVLFAKRCEIVPELKSKKKKWMLYDTKIPGLDLKFEIDRHSATVMIELNHRNEDKRLALFEKLQKYKPLLEEGFDDGLNWSFLYTRENGEEVCRIFVEQSGFDVHNRNQWPDIYNFFIRNMLTLENNFRNIKEFLDAELENE